MRQQPLKLLSLLLVFLALSAATAYPVAQADVVEAKSPPPTSDEIATLTLAPALLVGLENRAPSAPLASFGPSMTEETEPNGIPAEANTIVGDAAAPEVIYSPPLSITTFFASNNGFAGNMFDVANISPNAIVINSFDINLATGGTGANISVYYTPNTYVGKESDSSQWTLMGTDTVDSAGTDQPTSVGIGGLVIPPGESYGFYLTVSNYPAASMRYTNGDNVISNADLSLTLGIGKGDPDFTGSTFTSRTWNGTIYYSPSASASISVNKTVGTDPNACATGNDLTLPATGGDVTYCYTVENTGIITLTNHTLVDDQLGTILNNFPFALAPGASTFITQTAPITQTVVNSATWTADNGSVTVDSSDMATVTVPIANPSIVLTETVGVDPAVCATTDAISLPFGGGDATFCFTIQNTGDITLTHHYVFENILGVVLNNVAYELAPNATAFVTGTANITQTYNSGSVWQAFIDGSPVPIVASDEGSATVTVGGLITGVDLSADDAQSGAVGEVVTYTVAITNTGNAQNSFALAQTGGAWAAALSETTILLDAEASTTFEVVVTVPLTAADGQFDTAVILATGNGGVTATVSLTTTAVVVEPPPTYGVQLSADDSQSGDAGTAITYTLHLTNTGDVADTFNLSVASVWTATPSTTSVTLAAGASAQFTVVVSIPSNATNGQNDVATVTATSLADNSATDTAQLTTTAVVENPPPPPTPVIYLPMVMRP